MFGLLVLVGLFVALTPGVLFRLKGSKKMSAAMHAVLFGVVVYVVSTYFMSYDGFQDAPSPCRDPYELVGNRCVSGEPVERTSYDVLANGKCKSSKHKLNNGKCFHCPTGYSTISGGMCQNIRVPQCPSSYDMEMVNGTLTCVTAVLNGPIVNKNGETIEVGSRVKCGNFIKTSYTVTGTNPKRKVITGQKDNGATQKGLKASFCVLDVPVEITGESA
jgi:hypothetical protein